MHLSDEAKSRVRWLAIRIAALPLIFVVVSAASHVVLYGPPADDPECCSIDTAHPELERLREEGFGDPWIEEYAHWLRDVTNGNLGQDFFSGRSIASELRRRIAPTAEIMVLSFVLAVAIASAVSSAGFRRVARQRGTVVLGALLGSVPVFVTAVLAIIYPAMWWSYSAPVGGFVSLLDDPLRNFRIVFPPSVVIALATTPILMRRMTSADPRPIRARTAVLALAWWFPVAIGMTVIVEPIFAIRGLGEWFVRSLLVGDRAVVQTLITTVTCAGVALRLFLPLGESANTPALRPLEAHAHMRDRLVLVALAIIAATLLAAVIGPILSPYDPRALDVNERYLGPSFEHWFGTNQLGQDLLARLLSATRNTLLIVAGPVIVGVIGAVTAGRVAILGTDRVRSWIASGTFVVAGASGFWWLLLIIGVPNRHNERNLFFLLAAGVFVLALSRLNRVLRELGTLTRATVTCFAVRMAAIVAESLASTIVIVATLDFVGLGFGYEGDPSLGFEIRRGLNDGIPYHHMMWFPIGTLALPLFALNVISATMGVHERGHRTGADGSARSRSS